MTNACSNLPKYISHGPMKIPPSDISNSNKYIDQWLRNKTPLRELSCRNNRKYICSCTVVILDKDVIFSRMLYLWEVRWPYGYFAHPGPSSPWFKPWLGKLCCALGQDTRLPQCLSPSRCINGYQRIVGENLTNRKGVTYVGLASHPVEVEILLAASCYSSGS